MDSEAKIDKILELQVKQSTNIALIQQAQELHLKDYTITKKSHYNLRDQVNGIKARVILISTGVMVIVTTAFNWLWNTYTGK